MKVTELSKEQLNELKQAYLCEQLRAMGCVPDMSQLIYVDDEVTDLEVYSYYADFIFTNDDFFCTAGKEDE